MTKEIILSANQKSLQVNLDSKIYGTFIETGAGQEVVRHFFRSGMASGTIAKSMSAYDKDFSNSIYGKEKDGRYVSESRLQNMIEKEYGLLEDRLDRKEHKDKKFFAFANTMTTYRQLLAYVLFISHLPQDLEREVSHLNWNL